VIEIAWRIDHGKAGTVHELFADEGQGRNQGMGAPPR
jgi:hypothetical protein